MVKKSTVELTAKQLRYVKKTTHQWGRFGGKGYNLLGSIKIKLWSNGKRSCGLSPDLLCSRVMEASGQEEWQMKWWTHRALCLPYMPVGAVCYDLGCFSWYTEWPGFSINWFFPSLMARAYFKMTVPQFIGLKLFLGSVTRHFIPWIGYHSGQIWTPLTSIWDVLEKTLHSSPTLPSSIQSLMVIKMVLKNEFSSGQK